AIRLYQRKVGDSLRAQNAAAEIKIRAERRIGELIPQVGIKRGGDRAKSHAATLAGIGISKSESSRVQAIAAVPKERFEEVIARTNEANKELTSKTVYDMGRTYQKQRRREELVEAARAIEVTGDIYTGDLSLLNDLLADDSADLFFSDPPYH